MIDRLEIDRKSEELGVHTSNVQRDYVFGWLLAGIFQRANPLSTQLILKGGNAFRKAYFEQARFSNDLDFSSQTELRQDTFADSLRQACLYAKDHSGVEFVPDANRITPVESAEEDSRMFEARVYFRSFYGEEHVTLKAKLDIKEYDQIFLPVQTRRLIHSYSDAQACTADIRSHKLEELLASKLKAMLHRQHSPDLFDFVYSVFFQKALDVRRLEVISTFLKKTIYEPDPRVARNLLLELPFQVIRGFWDKYMVCPKASLMTFDDAERSFKALIPDLFALLEPRFATAGGPGGYRLSYFSAAHRDKIMEAGRLQRMLRLLYDGHDRLVEPYSLAYKRRRDGVAREYFYAWDTTGGRSGQTGIKSFIADKVQSLTMTEQTFEPRYPIELVKGPGYFGKQDFTRRTAPTIATRRSQSSFYGSQSYTVECPYCGKRFRRTTYDVQLNPHKDKYGNNCYGRMGHIV